MNKKQLQSAVQDKDREIESLRSNLESARIEADMLHDNIKNISKRYDELFKDYNYNNELLEQYAKLLKKLIPDLY